MEIEITHYDRNDKMVKNEFFTSQLAATLEMASTIDAGGWCLVQANGRATIVSNLRQLF